MPSAADNTAFTTVGQVITNVAVGKKGFEYPSTRPRAWRLKAMSGVSGGQATLYIGDRLIFVDRTLPFGGGATTPTYPSWNDQEIDRGVMFPGEAFRLDLKNNSATAAINIVWEVAVYP